MAGGTVAVAKAAEQAEAASGRATATAVRVEAEAMVVATEVVETAGKTAAEQRVVGPPAEDPAAAAESARKARWRR